VGELKHFSDKSLNLAFLDPEGLELCWMTVAKLAGIRRMDLVINYPEGGLNRMMCNVYQSKAQVDLFWHHGMRKIYAEYRENQKVGVHRAVDLYERIELGYKEVLQR
jgi:hypothetical protein